MSDNYAEKTEQPTPRRLEEAVKKGEFARSAEVQTVFVFIGAMLGMTFSGREIWQSMVTSLTSTLGHLHQMPVTTNSVPIYLLNGALLIAKCAGPIVVGCLLGGLLAGGVQNRFQTASEAFAINWERCNPVAGLQRIFSLRSAVPSLLAVLKLSVIMAMSYSTIESILRDPIFYSTVGTAKIAGFLAESGFKIFLRLTLILAVIAALDYAYQFWRHQRDMMMTKEEVREEAKTSEANPRVRAQQRKRSRLVSQRKMLAEVPKADVVVTNPTHLAVALKYDSKTMKAPKIVAKGARLHAQRIREIAQEHQVPIVENKPVARLMYKHGKVGGEIPAQLYVAVAEILAWVYRVNRYRYYSQQNQA